VECYELTTATIASEELTAVREAVTEDTPDSKRQARAFEPMEGSKEVPVDPNDSNSKVLRVDAALSPK
jgi:hypothetical protein